MDYLKGLNVIILSLLLILTGCFGLLSDDEEDSAEAQVPVDNEGSSTATVTTTLTAQEIADAMMLATNSPPELSVKTFDFSFDDFERSGFDSSNWDIAGYFMCTDQSDFGEDSIGDTLDEQRAKLSEESSADIHLANLVGVGDCIIWFDFLSVDPDGDLMTKGIDTDFDGIIDIPIEPNHGLTMAAIDNTTDKHMWNGRISTSCEQIDLAFIAIDVHGASTAEFMHFWNPESCEEIYASTNLVFSGMDGNEEGAVVVSMDQGMDLEWSSLRIKAAVDGAASKTMVACSATVADDCYEHANPANPDYWGVGEAVTVKTADCNGICEVVVSIMDDQQGVILDIISITTE